MDLDLASITEELTADEKRALYDALAYDLRGEATQASDEMCQLWTDLHDALKMPSKGRQPLSSFLAQAGQREKFLSAVGTLDDLLIVALPARCARTIRIQVRSLVLKCLIDWLRRRGIPASPKTVISNFLHLRYAIDQAYPGYIEAQLLHRVVSVLRTAA